jgi:hypothetical protein
MKHLVRTLLACAGLAAALPAAQAGGNVYWSVGIDAPVGVTAVSTRIGNLPPPPPVVYAPAPVIVQPAPVVYAPPVVLQPAPVVAYPRYVVLPPGHRKHGWKHCQRYGGCGYPVVYSY